MFNVKFIIPFFCILYCCASSTKQPNPNTEIDTLTDERDGQTYKIMKLRDGRHWMVENLNYKTDNSWCFDDQADNCSNFGRLYNGDTALTACPKGWKIPSEDDWINMADLYKILPDDSEIEAAPKYSKWTSKQRHAIFENLLSIGFTDGKSGVRMPFGDFINLSCRAQFWTSTKKGDSFLYSFYFGSCLTKTRFARDFKSLDTGQACRCIKQN